MIFLSWVTSTHEQADAADADAVKAAVEKTVATFGRLDVLANNAGTAYVTGANLTVDGGMNA